MILMQYAYTHVPSACALVADDRRWRHTRGTGQV